MTKRGFSMVELLVVVAIIVALVGILLPSLSDAFAETQKAVCMAKLKQMHMAGNMYARDNTLTLPRIQWKSQSGGPEDQIYTDAIFSYMFDNVKDDDGDNKIDGKYYDAHGDVFKCPTVARGKRGKRNKQFVFYGINHYGRSDALPEKDRYFKTFNARSINEVANTDAIWLSDADHTDKNGNADTPEDIGGGTRGNTGNPLEWPLVGTLNVEAYIRHRRGYNIVQLDGATAWYPGEELNHHKWHIKKFWNPHIQEEEIVAP